MLYKKNKEKTLSHATFSAPTSEYRATPFWAWNCKMTPEILERQIEYLRDMGFGGFHMHSRSGMDNAYLSDEFMSLVRACVDKAKSENMLAWLYDEDRWPSGAAGGLVTKTPKYRGRILYFAPMDRIKTSKASEKCLADKILYDITDEEPKAKAIEEGKPYFIAAYDVKLDSNGYISEYKKIARGAKAEGKKWIAFSATQKTGNDWYNGYCYVDTLSKDAMKKFVEVTHETYKKWVGDEFDKVVPAIFTDEPQFCRKNTLERPTDESLCCLPWTPDFDATYKKAYGEDIVEKIPELIWDLPSGKISAARYRYHDHACQRFTDAFSKICGEWCDKNGLPLTGHMMEEPTLMSQTHAIGEAMRAYKYFGYPGIDMLCNFVELTTAKQTQSVVHQYGKEAMLSELYGVTNWDFDFRGHKFQGDWQAALGVTVRVPHLSWVSMKGDAKRDYPASISYQSPWFREYKYVEDHYARLNTALTRGKPDVSIAVIHPIESYWLHWGPAMTTLDIRNKLDGNFNSLIKWLLFAGLDFDYISESMFPDACKKVENPISVGKMKYDVIVVPELETMRRTTFTRLKEFKEAGGRVIFMGECPKYIDCVESDELAELYYSSERTPFDRNAIVNALEANRKVAIRSSNGVHTDNYIYQLRRDGKYSWLFIANAKVTPTEKGHTTGGSHDVSEAKALNIRVKGAVKPVLYDTITGEIKEVSYRIDGEYTEFAATAYYHDSFLYRLEPTKKASFTVSEKRYKVIKTVDFKASVDYKRQEDNVLLLDIAEWKWDDEKEYRPLEEIRRLDAKLRRAAGIPRKSGKQPWTLEYKKPEHKSFIRFTFGSDIDIDGVDFACEDMDVAEIYLDGKKIEKRITGFFTDECIKRTALPTIAKGEHKIELVLPLSERTYTENCFLLGNFGVKLVGIEPTLIAPAVNIGFGSVTTQGMPFYGGNVDYMMDIDVPEGTDSIKIHTSLYRGALVSVKIDGEDVGKIVYQPYDLKVDGVTPGKHTLTLTLFGNRHNSFGALHNCDFGWRWFGPSAWVTSDDAFSYEHQIKPMGILRSPEICFLREE